MAERKRKGRPVSVGRAAVFSTRLSAELRQKLEGAAASAGTTLTDQIEMRLARSFEDEAPAVQDRAALRVIGEIMRRLDSATGRRWAEDAWSYAQLEQAVSHLLREWRPRGEPVKPAAVPRFTPEEADQLGVYMARNVIAQLDFTEPEGTDPFARLKADLGDLANRGGGQ